MNVKLWNSQGRLMLLGCLVTLLSTFCMVQSYENDDERQLLPYHVPDGMDQGTWAELYEQAIRDADVVFKRAPSSGFYGMRGKKVPAQNFYGMRGKKGPSGFLGVRGKKMDPRYMSYLLGAELDEDYQGRLDKEGRPPLRLSQGEQQLGPADNGNGAGDHSLADKRVPSNGFIGMRGKRSLV